MVLGFKMEALAASVSREALLSASKVASSIFLPCSMAEGKGATSHVY